LPNYENRSPQLTALFRQKSGAIEYMIYHEWAALGASLRADRGRSGGERICSRAICVMALVQATRFNPGFDCRVCAVKAGLQRVGASSGHGARMEQSGEV
jgi:hypothetical protein